MQGLGTASGAGAPSHWPLQWALAHVVAALRRLLDVAAREEDAAWRVVRLWGQSCSAARQAVGNVRQQGLLFTSALLLSCPWPTMLLQVDDALDACLRLPCAVDRLQFLARRLVESNLVAFAG